MSFFKTPLRFYMKDGANSAFKDWLFKLFDLYKVNHEDSAIFASDNIIATGRNLGFLREKKFVDLANKYFHDDEVHGAIIWRIHVLSWAINYCKNLEGDLVEFGCYDAVVARFLVDYCNLEETNKNFYLYDIFDNPPKFKGPKHSPDLFSEVKKMFADKKLVKVVKGLLPESFIKNGPDKISFVHLDLNEADAEIAILKIIFNRLVKGGMIILDDYGWSGYKEQHIRERDFFNDKNHQIMELPTGQGLIIKN